ncbi:MAG: hypothetical protein K1Y36_09930 [Blastocatellia bacterium]|nr:hypothetical protein [Blastocatellia bacterium]
MNLEQARKLLTFFLESEPAAQAFTLLERRPRPTLFRWVLRQLRPEANRFESHFPEPTRQQRLLQALTNRILESPSGILVDWRATIDEAIEAVSLAVRHYGVEITAYPLPDVVRTDWSFLDVTVKSAGVTESLKVRFSPKEAFSSKGSLDGVLRQIEVAARHQIRFFALTLQVGSDSFGYAVLKPEQWKQVQELLGKEFDEVFLALMPPNRE